MRLARGPRSFGSGYVPLHPRIVAEATASAHRLRCPESHNEQVERIELPGRSAGANNSPNFGTRGEESSRTFGRSRPLWSKIGVLGLALTCQSAIAQQIQVLSSRADTVSGGDAVIQVGLPAGISTQQVTILHNGSDVTSGFVATDVRTLQGLVSGLNVGLNTLVATSRVDGRIIAKLAVQNWPLYGPVFAGPRRRPWICETEASGLGPPPASGPCVAPTRYDWFYRTTLRRLSSRCNRSIRRSRPTSRSPPRSRWRHCQLHRARRIRYDQ